MPNKSLFNSTRAAVPKADTVNDAGGQAYRLSSKQALAQIAMTGTFNGTFYASAKQQLETIQKLLPAVDAEFLAKLAVAARTRGFMKDMPAYILTYIAMKHRDRKDLLSAIFPLIVDNGKMLRNVMTFVRSGTFDDKRTFPQPLRRELAKWFDRSVDQIFRATVGNDPSMRDILRMLHVRPKTPLHDALFAYIVGKPSRRKLPELVKKFEAFKKDPDNAEVPKVDFRMLAGVEISPAVWSQIARDARWMMTRMNLNTFKRHGVFDDAKMVTLIANRLKDAEQIKQAMAFPYQLLAAYCAVEATGDMPREIIEALHDAMEIATDNVPEIEGSVVVCPDVSGSMSSAGITGSRGSATSTVRCVDVAALITAAILRKNRSARVLPFECTVKKIQLEPRDSVMTNARKLAAIGGGGTNCSAPLSFLNSQKAKVDVVIFVSDYESWADRQNYGHGLWDAARGTGMMEEWKVLKARNPKAKLICIDLIPHGTAQVSGNKDILQVGGFSDQVFTVVSDFVKSSGADAWIKEIESIDLNIQATAKPTKSEDSEASDEESDNE
jgi:60 kDa SS-A/Ro ribonucleoprotein